MLVTGLGIGIGITGNFCAVSSAEGSSQLEDHTDLTELSLEDLLNLEVTSVAKKSQRLSEAAAAVFVITQEDIRRSGVTNIPDALRMAPGVQVARISANQWAISVRGFNNVFSNKLLVLIDGRSVYTPLFSGVYWDVQDTVLEDIERIEVIRGPGATLWGANAVNGVINIITKTAADTQGGLVSAGAGTEELGFGTLRYGESLGNEQGHYRVYAKYFKRDGSVNSAGKDLVDDWEIGRGGFRFDYQASGDDSFTTQGDIYSGDVGEETVTHSLNSPLSSVSRSVQDVEGGNMLARWQRDLSEVSNLSLQLYYDRTKRETLTYLEDRDTIDLDFQHRFVPMDRHDVLWGLGYRYTGDEVRNSFTFSVQPKSRNDQLYSAFIQDDIILARDRLQLILGSKFEHNDYSGFEIQPNARLLWSLNEQQTLWSSIARAVRTPSRGDHDFRLVLSSNEPGEPQNPFPLPLLTTLNGSQDFDSEELIAYEIGYRYQITPGFGLDIAIFYNDYDKLRSISGDGLVCRPTGTFPLCLPPASQFIETPLILGNDAKGESYGIELAVDWRAAEWWRLQSNYSFLDIHMESKAGGAFDRLPEKQNPHHQASVRAAMDLHHDITLDLWLRYVDNLPAFATPSYVTLDARMAWLPLKTLELSIIGQNLFEAQHKEAELNSAIPSEVERAFYGQVRWWF